MAGNRDPFSGWDRGPFRPGDEQQYWASGDERCHHHWRHRKHGFSPGGSDEGIGPEPGSVAGCGDRTAGQIRFREIWRVSIEREKPSGPRLWTPGLGRNHVRSVRVAEAASRTNSQSRIQPREFLAALFFSQQPVRTDKAADGPGN